MTALVFAVIDGTAIPDLPRTLARLKAQCACLYAIPGTLPGDIAKAAPWLVSLPPDSAIAAWWLSRDREADAGITGLMPATGPDAWPQLLRHLRSLGLVRLPGGKLVLFRFFDPRVLNRTLPLLNPGQRARFFGPITVLWAESGRRGVRIPVTRHLPPSASTLPVHGLLSFSPLQLAALDGHAVGRFCRNLITSLRRTDPAGTRALDDPALLALIHDGMARARRFGITSARGIACWVALALRTRTDFCDEPAVRRFLLAPGMAADTKPGWLLEALAARATGRVVPCPSR